MKLSFESGDVNAQTQGSPGRPAIVAADIQRVGRKNNLADEGRRADSAAKDFQPKM
jgi:hypothetical protein